MGIEHKNNYLLQLDHLLQWSDHFPRRKYGQRYISVMFGGLWLRCSCFTNGKAVTLIAIRLLIAGHISEENSEICQVTQ